MRLLDQLEDPKHRQVHCNDDATNDGTDDYDHQWLYDRGKRLHRRIDLGLVEVGDLDEHPVYIARLFTDGDHARHHRREDRLVFKRLVDRQTLPNRLPALEQSLLDNPVPRRGRRDLESL